MGNDLIGGDGRNPSVLHAIKDKQKPALPRYVGTVVETGVITD
jgi:hypothetical protein